MKSGKDKVKNWRIRDIKNVRKIARDIASSSRTDPEAIPNKDKGKNWRIRELRMSAKGQETPHLHPERIPKPSRTKARSRIGELETLRMSAKGQELPRPHPERIPKPSRTKARARIGELENAAPRCRRGTLVLFASLGTPAYLASSWLRPASYALYSSRFCPKRYIFTIF